jgi:hypothetical protein
MTHQIYISLNFIINNKLHIAACKTADAGCY